MRTGGLSWAYYWFSFDNRSYEKFQPYFQLSLNNLIDYFKLLRVSMHEILSLFGFFTFLTIAIQLISGIMLSFSFIPEPMLVPIIRDEEDLEDLYTDDFFWMHERGVDFIFIFIYLHLLRKLYLNIFEVETEAAWKSGVLAFLVFQVVVFLGLVLCCTHLSEITLAIAANIFMTFLYVGKMYWWIFTDKLLNADTLIRLLYAHYLSAFFLFFLGIIHGIDMHFDWKNDVIFDGLASEMQWWEEALSNELAAYFFILWLLDRVNARLFQEIEGLTYEIFMWGDIGFVNDIRFLGVAPHWYFRPLMAWLLACPFHIYGIFGLVYFFLILYYQPNLHGTQSQNNYSRKVLLFLFKKLNRADLQHSNFLNVEILFYFKQTFYLFMGCFFYTTSFLPYGKFFNSIGGNWGFVTAYLFIFAYLGLRSLRRALLIILYIIFIALRASCLNRLFRCI